MSITSFHWRDSTCRNQTIKSSRFITQTRGPHGATETTEQPKNGERFVVLPDGAGGVRLERR